MKAEKTEVVVLGAGPGGYTAAFYAADKGKKVILVDQDKRLGGVCLNRGCIPSKALIHATHIVNDAKASASRGITFIGPKIDIAKLRKWKESILDKLSGGIAFLAEKRGVEIWNGRGYFEDSNTLRVETDKGQKFIEFDTAILATGSKAALPSVFDLGNPRVMTSKEALEIKDVPAELLVIGGGYIGVELGTIYSKLGSQVTLVEALDSILTGADPDLVRPVSQWAAKNFKEVRLSVKILKMATQKKKIKVTFELNGEEKEECYDKVLVAVGRVPNGEDLGLENTEVQIDDKGFVQIDSRCRTSDPSIYAIGDIAGGLLLAHKAYKEARIAVENIVGERATGERVIIPAVVFSDPEVAWCGITETEARQKNIEVEVVRFPWSASGRALTMDRQDGLTKLIIEPSTERILGVGIVGIGAGELIGEGVLALEMGATARDLGECVHPHPTLSETLMEAAESFYGYATSVLAKKKTKAS